MDVKIRDKKLHYDINREVAKVSALSSGEIDKYEYFIGEENYLPIKEERQNEFPNYSLGKAFEKQIKIIEDQEKKKIKALEEHEKQLVQSSYERKFSIHLK